MVPQLSRIIRYFALLAASACVRPLSTLPPSEVYVDRETPPRDLTNEEKRFVEGINADLQKLGMPPAALGGYEMNAAAVIADLGLAKLYRGSSREFAEDNIDERSTTSQEGHLENGPRTIPVRNDPNGFLTQVEDIDFGRLHLDQHMASRGLPFDFYSDVQIINYEQRGLTDNQLLLTARRAHFQPVYGQLRIGVAILVDGEDGKRFYALVLRDERINMVKGAPRRAKPGGSFELAGQLVDRGLKPLEVGIEGPSLITMDPVEVAGDGTFRTTIKLPSVPGLYVVSAGRAQGNDPVPYSVAVFVGMDPTPWPAYATGKPPGDAYALAGQIAQAVNAFRQRRGLPALSIPADLAAFEKAEAKSYGDALYAADRGDTNALADWSAQTTARAKAAGIDAAGLEARQVVLTDLQAETFPARFPSDAMAAFRLAQPGVTQFGLGIAILSRTSASPDQRLYVVSWATAAQRTGTEEPQK